MLRYGNISKISHFGLLDCNYLLQAEVTKIVYDGAKVTGVQVLSNGKSIVLNAPLVISSAGLHNTFRKLLPKEVAVKSPLYELQQGLAPSPGLVIAFVGFDKSDEELGLKAESIWYYKKPDCGQFTFEEYCAGPVENALEMGITGKLPSNSVTDTYSYDVSNSQQISQSRSQAPRTQPGGGIRSGLARPPAPYSL